jgi:hypothetical protein
LHQLQEEAARRKEGSYHSYISHVLDGTLTDDAHTSDVSTAVLDEDVKYVQAQMKFAYCL